MEYVLTPWREQGVAVLSALADWAHGYTKAPMCYDIMPVCALAISKTANQADIKFLSDLKTNHVLVQGELFVIHRYHLKQEAPI